MSDNPEVSEAAKELAKSIRGFLDDIQGGNDTLFDSMEEVIDHAFTAKDAELQRQAAEIAGLRSLLHDWLSQDCVERTNTALAQPSPLAEELLRDKARLDWVLEIFNKADCVRVRINGRENEFFVRENPKQITRETIDAARQEHPK